MTLKVGDVVEVIEMPEDPLPVEPGTRGVVRRIWNPGTRLEQIAVDWENGRSLFLLPTDKFKIIRET